MGDPSLVWILRLAALTQNDTVGICARENGLKRFALCANIPLIAKAR